MTANGSNRLGGLGFAEPHRGGKAVALSLGNRKIPYFSRSRLENGLHKTVSEFTRRLV